MPTILIADDEAKFRKILTLALTDDGHEVIEAGDAEEAIEILKKSSINLVITDLRMPKGGGMTVLDTVQKAGHSIPIIILTAYGTIENAVEALKKGAHDYVMKPCDLEELKNCVRKALQMQHLELENIYLRRELNERFGDGILTGKSVCIQKVMDQLFRVAQSDGCVLIQGETGTGKELAARAVHKKSRHSSHPFVTVKCASMPADLLETELFGRVSHLRSSASTPAAGKFETAGKGTIFLDEIGDLPPRLQGRILRTIEERVIEPVGGTRSHSIHARIITATSTDLEEKVRKEEFRSDLYFRLNVLPIVMPTLRERKEDIPLLIEHFVKLKTNKNSSLQFSTEDMQTMMQYAWHGNVRELENVVERAVVLGTTDVNLLIPSLASPAANTGLNQNEWMNLSYKEAKKSVMDDFETLYFSSILRRTKGNISRAAELAQIHRKNLHVKLNELDVDPKRFAQPDESAGESSAG